MNESSKKVMYRFLISGRVQGVFYRASTREQAHKLNLTGHAKNLPDGRVEVLACGDLMAIGNLEQWLWQGPMGAEVLDVEKQVVESVAESINGFGIY